MTSEKESFPARELRISVLNEQRAEGFSDTVRETSFCSFRRSGDKFYISYKAEGSRVMLKVERASISMKRTGEFGASILYIPGSETEFEYRTPYGSIPMSVFTKHLEYDLNEDGGVIEFGYIMNAGGDELTNMMRIIIER